MSRAAIRYAKAVLETATQSSISDKIFVEMQTIAKTIASNQELKDFLNNPVIKPETKKAALLEIFSVNSDITDNLLKLLVDNKRTDLLQLVAENYLTLYNQQKGAVTAIVTTAIPLDEKLEAKVLAKVKELTKATDVTLESKVDPAIIGGFILRIGDLQYDASIVNHFEKLKKEFNTSI